MRTNTVNGPEIVETLLNNIDEIVALSDVESSVITYANQAFFKKSGYTADDLDKIRIIDVSHTRSDLVSWSRYVASVRQQPGHVIGGILLTKKGEKIPSETSAQIITWQGREYVLSVVRKVSSDNILKKYLEDGRDFYKTLLENSFQGMSVLDSESRIIYVNSEAIKILNYPAGQLIGMAAEEVLATVSKQDMETLMAELLANPGKVCPSKMTVVRGDGELVNVECNSVNLLDDPKIHGIVTCFRDTTEKNILEQQRQKHRIYLQKILDSLPIMVWTKDMNGRFTSANEAFASGRVCRSAPLWEARM